LSRRGDTTAFLRSVFRAFYRENYKLILPPARPEAREFGYWSFEGDEMVRHLSFRSADEVRAELARIAPRHAYRSAAYYRYPAAPMEEKGWLAADLAFDIDADHLNTPCLSQHTFSICRLHGLLEENADACRECGSRARKVEWVCEACLNAARSETARLVEILLDELGVDEESIIVAFSGNRGYHVVSHSFSYLSLDAIARRDLVGYLTLTGIDPGLHGLPGGGARRGRLRLRSLPNPSLEEAGLRGRLVRRIYTIVQSREIPAGLGGLEGEIEKIWEAWSVEPSWEAARPSVWRLIVNEAVRQEAVRIDPVVTTDVHRLLRMAGTLNGKTGLLARIVPLEELDDFDPLEDSVALPRDRRVRVRVAYSPAFRLGGEEFDEVSEPRALELPLYAAVYLIAKELASPEAC